MIADVETFSFAGLKIWGDGIKRSVTVSDGQTRDDTRLDRRGDDECVALESGAVAKQHVDGFGEGLGR